jgi:hypothetical protein
VQLDKKLNLLFVDYLKDRKSSKRKQKEKEKPETKDKAKL